MKKSELRKIIKETIKEYGSNEIPKNTNWTEFAEAFDIGILDLDKFAYLMKLKNFKNLDISITPRSLLQRDPKKFVKALQQSSLAAEDMNSKEIVNIIDKL